MTRKTSPLAIALAAFLLLGGTPPPSTPRALHVATTGSDANPGTGQLPLRTVRYAVDVVSAGDTILIHGGVYDGIILVRSSGTEARPIVMQPAGDGPVTLQATLSPTSCAASAPTRDRTLQILSGTDHWIVRDLTIVGGVMISGTATNSLDDEVWDLTLPGRSTYQPESSATLLESLGSDPAEGIQLLGNKIRGRGIQATATRFGRILANEVSAVDCGTGAGILLSRFSDGWTIRDNFVHHNALSVEHPMEEGIRISAASNYNLIEENLIEDLVGRGRGVTTDVHAGWNVFRRNVTRRSAMGFNQQTGGSGNQWLENTAESNRDFGFNIDGKDHTKPRPDDAVPAQVSMRGNCSFDNPYDLNVGAVQTSTFSANAFRSLRLSDNARSYWTSAGNTYDGSSAPPPEHPDTYAPCPTSQPTPTILSPAGGSTIGVRGTTFSWTGLGEAVDVYDLLLVSFTTGDAVFSGSLRGTTATSTVLALEDGDYQFKVRGCEGTASPDACGQFSTVNFRVRLLAPANPPVIAAPAAGATLRTSTQTLSWSAAWPNPDGGSLRYEVLLEDVAAGTTVLRIATPELSTIFSMHSSLQYRLQVRACQQGCSRWSLPRSFEVELPPVPAALPAITGGALAGNLLDLTWTPVPNADLYQIQAVQPTGGPGGGALTVAARQVSTLTLASLPLPVGSANVVVRACNGDGCGPFSTAAEVTVTGSSPAAPNMATPIAGTTVTGPVVSLAWSRVEGDDGTNTVYRLYVQDLSRQAPALDVYTTQNFWSAFLNEGGRYDAVVIAPGGVAGSVSGFTVTGSSAGAPTMTAPAHQSAVRAGNVDLAWSPVPGATLYEYFVAVQGESEATVRGVTQGLSVKVPLVALGDGPATYSAIARACVAGPTCSPGGAEGWGPWSNQPGGPGVTNFTIVP